MFDAPTFIRDGLSWWATVLRGRTTLRRYDGHKRSENLARDFLNILYGFELENLNHAGVEYPSIDLGNKGERRICYQVTAEDTPEKVHACLASFAKQRLQERFRELKILLLVEERPSFPRTKFKSPPGIDFDQANDIVDFKRLGFEADNASPDTQKRLLEWMQTVRLCPHEQSSAELARTVRQQLIIPRNYPTNHRQIRFQNTAAINFESIYLGAYMVCEEEGGPELVLHDEINDDDLHANGGHVTWGDLISETDNTRSTPRFETDDVRDFGKTLTTRMADFLSQARWPIRLVAAFRVADDERAVLAFWKADQFTKLENALWNPVGEAGTEVFFRSRRLSDERFCSRWEQYLARMTGTQT